MMRRRSIQNQFLLFICLSMVLVPAQAEIIFTDVTEGSGLELPGVLNQSAAWGDYDDDGDVDLYLTNRGPNKLFRNDGNGVFTDVTEAAGVAGPDTVDGDGIGVSFADLDNDGDLDLFVSHINTGDDQLYRNDGFDADAGTVVFTDVAASAGVTIERSARGITLVDYNRDGLLDIYVLASGESIMYRNNGNLSFTDVAGALGINPDGRDVGVVATDIDNNGWPDLFVGNRSDLPSNLYLNNEGSFNDIATVSGITALGLGMGVISLDYDNDLDFDLYWTTWPGDTEPFVDNAFYRNNGNLTFTNVTETTGTADTSGWGISANIGDLDNDGFMDFYVTNGFADISTPGVLFHNQGDGTFADVTSLLPDMPADSRGITFADFDNDGDQDIYISADDDVPNKLYRNDSTGGNRFLKLNLIGAAASGIGARVEVDTDIRTTVQELSGGTGRGNQNPLELVFGLGQATEVREIRINWPSGQSQVINGAVIDSTVRIVEPGPRFNQYTGSWFGGPEQSGHGFSLEELGDNRYLAYWYVFDEEGNRHWVIFDGVRSLNRISGTAFTAQGGLFPPLFNVNNVDVVEWGSMEFVFENCGSGEVSWAPTLQGFTAGSLPIVKLATVDAAQCQ